ncbi:MAG: penicillin-binding protein activator [Pseudomonadota bacterium]
MTLRLPVLTVLLMLFIAGCAVDPTTGPERQPTTVQGLLSAAADTNDASLSQQYQLKAAAMLQSDGDFVAARTLLEALDPQQLDDELNDRYLWLLSRDVVERDNADDARALAEQLDPELPLRLDDAQRAAAFDAIAKLYGLAEHHLPQARTLILWAGSDAAQPDSPNERIWGALREVPRPDLEPIAERSSDYLTRGWMELALALSSHKQHEVEARSSAIRDWQKAWPEHQAGDPLPSELALLRQLPELRPNSVALALPLSGALGGAGQAVREGFMAAYYQDLADPDRATPAVTLHDTSARPFISIYAELLETNPDLVVGPLQKEALNQLTSQPSLPVPVMALNYRRDLAVPPDNLFQFGLGGEDEMRAIASRLDREDLQNALVFVPEGDWGSRMEDALRDALKEHDATLLDAVEYNDESNLNQVVAEGFLINQSRRRANALMRLTGTSMQFEPRRRQDTDAIVLLASPAKARQFNPLFAFYYGGDLPVYGSSLLYRGKPDPARDSDLDGIRFTDIPWVLNGAPEERGTLRSLFPSLMDRYDRLFALGFDSYRLTSQIQLLEKIDGYQLQGVTGLIRNAGDGSFERTPEWAVFRQGKPELLPATMADEDNGKKPDSENQRD